MKGVFDEAAFIGHVEEPLVIGYVVGKEPLELRAVGGRFSRESKAFERRMLGRDDAVVRPATAAA